MYDLPAERPPTLLAYTGGAAPDYLERGSLQEEQHKQGGAAAEPTSVTDLPAGRGGGTQRDQPPRTTPERSGLTLGLTLGGA